MVSAVKVLFFALRRFHTALFFNIMSDGLKTFFWGNIPLSNKSFIHGWKYLRNVQFAWRIVDVGKRSCCFKYKFGNICFHVWLIKETLLANLLFTCFCCFFSGKRQEILAMHTWEREDFNFAYNYIRSFESSLRRFGDTSGCNAGYLEADLLKLNEWNAYSTSGASVISVALFTWQTIYRMSVVQTLH